MAFVVRRELMAHKVRTNREGPDLVFGRTKTQAFFASTIRARANKAWTQAGLEPITPHEARHCAISYFIAAGLDRKQISTWAGTPRRAADLELLRAPGSGRRRRGAGAPRRLPHTLPPDLDCGAHCGARPPERETPVNTGVLKYRYRDSNPIDRSLRSMGIECLQAFQGVSEGFVCKNWSAIGPRSEGVVDQFGLALAGHVVGVDLGRADVLVAHPFLEGAEADFA